MRGKFGKKHAVWYAALLAVVVVALWVPLYNRIGPELAGIPFFYWFQLLLVFVAALITALAYRSGV
ncbi:MAG: DUF3311 domain-containing protein [Salinisphaera sp.]|nr:DUF3311 domain-containing protein [Salinisphaera sp.]